MFTCVEDPIISAIDNTIKYSLGSYADVVSSKSIEEIIEDLLNKRTRQIITEYKCHNCGGSLNIPNDKHVMICPYCNSVYAYGLQMINDRG